MDIQVTITDFIEGKTIMVDEHPIVNDKDYVDIITTPNELHFRYDGCNHLITGKQSKDELIEKMKSQVLFNVWFENNWMNNFSDYGIKPPVVYDHEEDADYEVNSIDNFINNCKTDKSYSNYINVLTKIAENEYKITIIESGSSD